MYVLHARFGNFYRSDCAVQCSSFFFPVLLKLGKINIVKSRARCFGQFFVIAKYTSLSGNIAINVISIFHRSLQTNLRNESTQFITIHPYNLVTATRKKSCSVRKCMVHRTNRRWSVQPLYLVVLTRFPR